MDDSDEDQRLPHHREPKEFVTLDKLAGIKLYTFLYTSLHDVKLSIALATFTLSRLFATN